MAANPQNPPIPSAEMLTEMAARGTQLRRERAEFLEPLRTGQVPPEEAVQMLEIARREENASTLGKIRALAFLMSVPHFGRVTAQQTMLDLRIMPKRHLASMSDKQAALLSAAILDKVSIRALTSAYGTRALPREQAVEVIRSASSPEGGTLRYLRVRDAVSRLPRITHARVLSVIESAGIGVNARFIELDPEQVDSLIEKLPGKA